MLLLNKKLLLNPKAIEYVKKIEGEKDLNLYVFFFQDDYILLKLPKNPEGYKNVKKIFEGLASNELVELEIKNLEIHQ